MGNIDLNNLAKQVHEAAKSKGFWSGTRNIGELFMLIVSELGEALEAHRKSNFAIWSNFVSQASQRNGVRNTEEKAFVYAFSNEIKDTFEDEIADTVIRILDYVGWRGDLKIALEDYEQQGDFQLFAPNVGEVLMEVTGFIFQAFQSAKTLAFLETQDELNALEAKINAALILLFNLSVCCEFQLLRHIDAKIKFNSTREHLHGKAY
jgi:NTP pyrophosphatase (non-canonical NTP hydrolase)